MENLKNSKNQDIRAFYNHEFDFSSQHKKHYRDWLRAFTVAIKRRAVNKCFMGLSSGYDSGAICNEFREQDISFKTYSILNNENTKVLNERLAYVNDCIVSDKMDKRTWQKYYDFLKGKINEKALKDIATMAVASMFNVAKKTGRTVFISGQGSDEIISDYALFPKQSTFKGKFPDKLNEWENFREGMQKEYLTALEEVASIYGIKIRYPFLDVRLVQEFLWLKPELKNRNYKAPLYEYLSRNNVPFDEGVKKGFRPI